MKEYLEIDWPFGQCSLAVATDGHIIGRISCRSVVDSIKLPDGYRVDECLLESLRMRLSAGNNLSLVRNWIPNQELETTSDSGENLDAFLVEKTGNEFAHFGTVDSLYLEACGFKIINVQYSDADFQIDLKTTRNLTIPFGIAASWTTNPKPDGGMLDSWFAVDSALFLQKTLYEDMK